MSVLVEQLKSGTPVIAAELRPPRAELETAASMDAWIDTYHAVRGLTRGGHVRLPDRQRRRPEGRRQPPPPRHQSRHRRAALARRPVPDLQAHVGVLPRLRRSRAAPRLRVAGGPRRRQARRAAALRRARLAAARDDPRARAGAGARADGPIRTANAAAQVQHLLDDRVTAEFYLTQIVSHHSRPAVERFLAEARAPRAWRCPACSACSTTARRIRARSRRCASSCRCRSTSCATSSPRARRRTRSARGRSASSPRRASGTSTSATCRSDAPRRRSRRSLDRRVAVSAVPERLRQ